MARDQGLDDQIESDEELLNFDLDDLSLSDDSVDDLDGDEEIIELVDLVERGSSEDITRDLKVREWAGAGRQRESPATSFAASETAVNAGDEEDGDLDISDLSIELEMDSLGDEKAIASQGDEITEADLEGLLEEDDSFTLDFSRDKDLEPGQKDEDEITDEDLQALLSETAEGEFEEEMMELEPLAASAEEVQGLEFDSSGETQALDLGVAEEEEAPELAPADEAEALDLEPPAEDDDSELKLALEEEARELEFADETQALGFQPPLDRGFVAAEPAELLADEAEELGAAADAEEEEAPRAAEAPVEPEEPEEMEFLAGLEEEEVREEEEVLEREAFPSISEERIEEIITNVVREAVERVARETMAEVAERMIGEAIETLKQSLEASDR